jgi:hypothetical protein
MANMNGFRSIEINLYQQRTTEFRGPSRQVMIAGGIAGFFLVLYLVWGFLIQSDLKELDAQLLAGAAEVSSMEATLQQMNASGRLDVWKDLPGAIERAHRSPLQLMKAFATHLPSDASVNAWSMDGTNTIRVDIDFGSTESLIRFRTTIAKDSQFQLLSMESFTNQQVSDGEAPVNYIPITSVNFVFQIPGPVISSAEGGAQP